MVSGLKLASLLWRWLRGLARLRGECIFPGRNEGNFRQVSDLTAGGVGYVDVSVLQKEPRGAIEFK